MRGRFKLWGAVAGLHRWLGTAGCLLFALWFTSGVAMMYVRMPELTADERFAHLAPLDAAAVRLSPADAAAVAGAGPDDSFQLLTLGGRPAYRFSSRTPLTAYADRAEGLGTPSVADVMRFAAAYAPGEVDTMRYAGRLVEPDQWTLQSRPHFPLHLVQLGDAPGSAIYVSSVTGEVVMDTTHAERFRAYLGPVAHWLYLPVLRRNGPLWRGVIIWASVAGCVLCLSGLLAGVLRYSPTRRLTVRGERTRSPYAGWMKWHHYAGLVFGAFTFTWTFSGLLSMGPFPVLSGGGPTADERRAVAGEASPSTGVTAAAVQTAIATAGRVLIPRELTVVPFRGRWYWMAAESPRRRAIVPVDAPTAVMPAFPRRDIEAAARDAKPGVVVELTWLDAYDAYYYDRSGQRPLPVLRARYADAEGTWMYFDPGRGAIALAVRRPDRVNRWLYHGLHSLDLPWLYYQRPLWDAILIVLSVGGLASAVTSLVPAWRRLRAWASRLAS